VTEAEDPKAAEPAKEADDKGAGKEGGDAADPKAADAGHDDVAQDKALIKKMLDEYVGKPEGDADHAEEMYQAAESGMAAAKEAGVEGDKAVECVGNAMKMAGILNAKKAKEAAASTESDDKDADDAEKTEEAHQESSDIITIRTQLKEAKTKIASLEGESAALREKTAKADLEKAVDEMLRESKLPMAVTKKFRETIADLKTKVEIEARFKAFKEAYELGRGGEATSDFGLVVQPEKSVGVEAGEGQGISLGDCVSE
jgi:hypothetical protein